MREITAAPGFNLPARSEKQIASNVLKGSLGNLIEWFDWYVYASFAIDGLFDTKAVGYLVERDIPEEGIKVEVLLLFRCQNQFADRQQDFVELRLHGIS